MRNQRTTAIIAAIAAVLAAVLGGAALWYGQKAQAWDGPLCNNIRSAITWTKGRMALEPKGTDAYATFTADKAELVKQLAEAKCDTNSVPSGTQTSTSTPRVTPSAAPSVPAACDTHFFTNDPNKISLRAFGPAVENNDTDKVTAEFFRRNTLDTALLAENLNVLGIRQDGQAGQQKLSEDLVKDCTARTQYVQQLKDLIARSTVSVVKPGAQKVGSAYMVDGPNGVPLLEWDTSIQRDANYEVFQVILPSGQKIWFRLACGFQYDKPGAPAPRKSVPTVRPCVSGEPRDKEGNCPVTRIVTTTATSTVTKMTPGPTATATTTATKMTPGPTATATTTVTTPGPTATVTTTVPAPIPSKTSVAPPPQRPTSISSPTPGDTSSEQPAPPAPKSDPLQPNG